MSNTNLSILYANQYKGSILVRGDTLPYNVQLKKLGGSWNKFLNGWIFRLSKEKVVDEFIKKIGSVKSIQQVVETSTNTCILPQVDETISLFQQESDITLGHIYSEHYTDKSIIIRGDTKQYKDQIKQLDGKWNPKLKGWIFPRTEKSIVNDFIKNRDSVKITNTQKKVSSKKVSSKKVSTPTKLYTEKYIMIKGDSFLYKETIQKMNGVWVPKVKGWLFPIEQKSDVQNFIERANNEAERANKEEESLTENDISNTSE